MSLNIFKKVEDIRIVSKLLKYSSAKLCFPIPLCIFSLETSDLIIINFYNLFLKIINYDFRSI